MNDQLLSDVKLDTELMENVMVGGIPKNAARKEARKEEKKLNDMMHPWLLWELSLTSPISLKVARFFRVMPANREHCRRY